MQIFRSKNLESIDEYKNVQEFLKSKARNSIKTSEIYGVAVGYLETFLKQYPNGKYNVETIIAPLIEKEIDVYKLIDNFVGFLETRSGNGSNRSSKLSARSIELYIAGIRSYLEYFDVDISSRKLKARVTLPKKFKIKKKALDSQDIRNLLLACDDQRLKALICILASSGARILEILNLKNSDIDLTKSPLKIFIKAEFTKTKQDRDIYVSREAVQQLKMFLVQKYPIPDDFTKHPNDLLFAHSRSRSVSVNPHRIYIVMYRNFSKLLKKVGMDIIRSGNRKHINFHLLRSFCKTVVTKQTSSDFSEFILGHKASTYYADSDEEVQELYLKCEKYLTFLDYGTVQSVGRDYESKLREKDQELQVLRDEIRELEKSQTQSQEYMEKRMNKLVEIFNDPKVGNMKKLLAGIELVGIKKKKEKQQKV